jgi:alpha-glucosidase (family GH31 glycosyl hydrolase)
MPNRQGNGVAAHHRYPVWWTGDGIPLMASVETMVDEAVHDFRPFVHSDCGGHVGGHKGVKGPSDTMLLRWTSHCVFGTIIRFHQVHYSDAHHMRYNIHTRYTAL